MTNEELEAKCEILLICILGCLDRSIKDRLTFYFDNYMLDAALNDLINRKLLPEFFGQYLAFDPIHNHLKRLRYLMALAARDALVRVSQYEYRLRLSKEETIQLAAKREINREELEQWTRTLEQSLSQIQSQRAGK